MVVDRVIRVIYSDLTGQSMETHDDVTTVPLGIAGGKIPKDFTVPGVFFFCE